MPEIPKDMLKECIVSDLTDLLPSLNDNMYEIFDDPQKLKIIRDNINSLYDGSEV